MLDEDAPKKTPVVVNPNLHQFKKIIPIKLIIKKSSAISFWIYHINC
jgi:hypothetical protein